MSQLTHTFAEVEKAIETGLILEAGAGVGSIQIAAKRFSGAPTAQVVYDPSTGANPTFVNAVISDFFDDVTDTTVFPVLYAMTGNGLCTTIVLYTDGTVAGIDSHGLSDLNLTVITTLEIYAIPSGNAIGRASVSLGARTKATGMGSFAAGNKSHAEGRFSLAIGDNAHAQGVESTALGAGTVAGDYAFVIGNVSQATGMCSTAIGVNVHASGERSVAIGSDSFANGLYTHATGRNAIAQANGSRCHGFDTTPGTRVQKKEVVVSIGLGAGNPAAMSAGNIPYGFYHVDIPPRSMYKFTGLAIIQSNNGPAVTGTFSGKVHRALNSNPVLDISAITWDGTVSNTIGNIVPSLAGTNLMFTAYGPGAGVFQGGNAYHVYLEGIESTMLV